LATEGSLLSGRRPTLTTTGPPLPSTEDFAAYAAQVGVDVRRRSKAIRTCAGGPGI
jgi:hypothetical protein